MTATATDNRKQRDVVTSDHDNDRVVDECGNPVPNVKLQKTPPGVNDALRSAAESLVGFDCFERLPEADNTARNEVVQLTVEAGDCFHSSLFKGRVSHTDLLSRLTAFYFSYGTIVLVFRIKPKHQ